MSLVNSFDFTLSMFHDRHEKLSCVKNLVLLRTRTTWYIEDFISKLAKIPMVRYGDISNLRVCTNLFTFKY